MYVGLGGILGEYRMRCLFGSSHKSLDYTKTQKQSSPLLTGAKGEWRNGYRDDYRTL